MRAITSVAVALVAGLVGLGGCAIGGAVDDEGFGRSSGGVGGGSDCHPGAPGCEDAGQTPPDDAGQTPDSGHTPDSGSCTWKTETCSMGGCNGHDGSDKAACYAAGNGGGCSAEVLEAWCTRRTGSSLWDDLHERWVKDRCGVSTATLTDNTFRAKNEATCRECECTTPLVLSFDGAPISLRPDDGAARFDLSSRQDGSAVRTDWPVQPWLALDRDGDGLITSGRELFGSATRLDGGTAQNGFQALTALDENGDGVIDAKDPAWSRLRLWADADGDRVSSAGELRTLAQAGIESLRLDYVVDPRCDARGNCEVERATFRFVDAKGEAHAGALVDVHLAVR